ncbi:MAG: polyprenyl synthetase family protein [Deferribacteres bacterium]|nr:polyprenyl synthetase family protein [candidate division KSB1 bacterium]MCB9510967.1 polyprenyl synthetase family protein [Deferribacteres bacterium]
MRLSEITLPIKDDLDAFEKQFKSLLKSDVFLIDKVIGYFIARKGKRLRPIMSLLVSRLNGKTPSIKRYSAAAIVELMHTASLMHDDVVDDSYKRRGFPSINSIWKNKVSVLTGDYMFSKVLVAMFDIRDFHAYDIVSTTAQRMSQGELLQLERSHDYWMEEEIYYRLIGDKTASLISAACQLGAVVSQSSEDEIQAMARFGENVGLAFQIRDDLLDLLGVEKVTGKPIGNDLRENKITLPLLHALKQAEKRDAKRIIKMMKKGLRNNNISTVVDFIKENGGVDYATSRANAMQRDALRELERYSDSRYKQVLTRLVEFITTREH